MSFDLKGRSGFQPVEDKLQQFVQVLTLVVACDLLVQVPPNPLDRVGLRVILGQEVQRDAVAQGVVDAAFGWTAFAHLAPDRVEIVELPEQQQIWRGTGAGLLSFSRQPELARQFMDFLTTSEARRFYREYGWVVPEG